MRGKRAKQYRKLMASYCLNFNFRVPYQVLVDAQMICDMNRFKMDLIPALSRTLHGEVKPMITQCSIRHLFALPTTSPNFSAEKPSTTTSSSNITLSAPLSPADKTALLNISRTLELRKCDHHTLPEPLSTLDCYKSFIDPNNAGTNKHHYILAVQDPTVRSWARAVRGVPMIYVQRSVVIMEPMSEVSLRWKEKGERGKLRGPVRQAKQARNRDGEQGTKRKQDMEGDEEGDQGTEDEEDDRSGEQEVGREKKKRKYGVKGPNPLSVKKKRDKTQATGAAKGGEDGRPMDRREVVAVTTMIGAGEAGEGAAGRRKRRRKHKSATTTGVADATVQREADVGEVDGG